LVINKLGLIHQDLQQRPVEPNKIKLLKLTSSVAALFMCHRCKIGLPKSHENMETLAEYTSTVK
jgi:hypothetical protein